MKIFPWEMQIMKRTNQTNATNATMPLLRHAIWGDIWKRTVEKRQTNATNVIMPLMRQAIWGHIWNHTAEKSQANATNVTLPALIQVLWGNIWRGTTQCHCEQNLRGLALKYNKPLRARIQIDEININIFTTAVREKFIFSVGGQFFFGKKQQNHHCQHDDDDDDNKSGVNSYGGFGYS